MDPERNRGALDIAETIERRVTCRDLSHAMTKYVKEHRPHEGVPKSNPVDKGRDGNVMVAWGGIHGPLVLESIQARGGNRMGEITAESKVRGTNQPARINLSYL